MLARQRECATAQNRGQMLSKVRDIIQAHGVRILPRSLVGRIHYYWGPKPESWVGGPFNAQTGRVNIFKAILDECQPIALVETGTFVATTTCFLAQSTSKPIYTVELDPKHYGYASERLRGYKNVFLEKGDSRSFLRRCVSKPNLQNGPVLFYLDAHWEHDLPLAEEIDIIFSALPEAIVIVDDFQVPGEPSYGYDDYGAGKALTSEYIAPSCQKFSLIKFFPSIPTNEETGAKRGCVVLARSRKIVSMLERINLLHGPTWGG
jgi:predicted O-methyltransferase YrrM